MPGWYDIVGEPPAYDLRLTARTQTSLSAIDRSEDETGIAESQKFFHDLSQNRIGNDRHSGGPDRARGLLAGRGHSAAWPALAIRGSSAASSG